MSFTGWLTLPATLNIIESLSIGHDEGLKHTSSVHCDELISIPKSKLTNYVGALSSYKLQLLDEALKIALNLDE